MRYTLAVLALATLAGCNLLGDAGETSPDVRLEANRAAYPPGDEVVLTLANASRFTYTIHPQLCGAALQQRQQAAWLTVSADAACTAVAHRLRPGATIVTTRPLSDTLSAGAYRYAYTLANYEEGERQNRRVEVEVFTKVFQIER